MKQLLIKFSVIIFIIVLISCRKDNNSDIANFPTSVGNKWVYYNDFQKNYLVKEIIGNQKINNVNCFIIKETEYIDSLLLNQIYNSSISFYSLQSDGLILVADSFPKMKILLGSSNYDTLVIFKNRNIIVKYPLNIGNSWTTFSLQETLDNNFNELGINKEIVDRENIKVSNKTYDCYVEQYGDSLGLTKNYWTNDGIIKTVSRLILKSDTFIANLTLIKRIKK
jgi:hypothetical protein